VEDIQSGKARELADMVGNAIVDDFLPLHVLKLMAHCLLEDYEQIVRAAEDMKEEERAADELRTGKKVF
jgi:hypothetical protein